MIPRRSLALAAAALLSCSREAPDLRAWQPSDHDHTENPGQNQVAPGSDAGAPSMARMLGVDEVVLTTWRAQCVTCHGLIGQGDGPQGGVTGARSFGDGAWQASLSDEQLSRSIREGKGAMPSFAALPESTVAGLVKLVRRMGPAKAVTPPAPSGDAAPAGDATP